MRVREMRMSEIAAADDFDSTNLMNAAYVSSTGFGITDARRMAWPKMRTTTKRNGSSGRSRTSTAANLLLRSCCTTRRIRRAPGGDRSGGSCLSPLPPADKALSCSGGVRARARDVAVGLKNGRVAAGARKALHGTAAAASVNSSLFRVDAILVTSTARERGGTKVLLKT